MGMFDSFYFHCQNCSSVIEEQSKAGPCMMNRYTLANMHPAVAGSLNGRKGKCHACGWQYMITIQFTVSILPWDESFDETPEEW